MKGDFTRSTFDHKKQYSGVRMQQGRVQLDADWNEQVDIQTHLLRQSLQDVVGSCGAPLQNAGFGLTVDDDNNLMIGAGHYYVHGTLCENERKCNYLEQENIKDARLPKADGNYLFYLDVWQKHITSIEDESISEIALGGPDTTTRTKTIWQVKRKWLEDNLDENPCIQSFAEWDELIAERDAQLKASVDLETDSTDPCIVPSGAGYRGLENYLYRVEIHNEDGTTFKWSRDNGSILRAVDTIGSNFIKIRNAGQDILHAFEPGQWIEITDEKRELNEEPGTLVHLTEVKDGVELKFDPDDPDAIIGDTVNSDKYPEEYNPKVRRWDQTESGEIKIDSEWIELEHRLGVEFKTDNTYESGDFWLIPARTANGDIEWSKENGGWHQRFGIEHRYCPLAIVTYKDEEWEIDKDCRQLFPNMTEMVTLSYVGGDSQEAMPGKELPAPLQVRVSVGQHPIKNARVQFSITDGNGNLKPRTKPAVTTLTINTGDDGLAEISLQLDKEYSEDETSIGVEASLLDAMLLDDEGESIGIHPSIHFQANVSIAKSVYYDPELCPELNEKRINTVQDAIDELCKEEPGIHIKDIYINSAGTDQTLANDSKISVDDLANGIRIRCDQKINPIIEGKPTCFVTLDIPYPFNSADRSLWSYPPVIGFQPLILTDKVSMFEEYLFSWDNIPGLDNRKLIKFLKQKYRIDWVETAKIEKIDNGNTIKVSTEKNSLYLILNDKKTNVSLRIDDVRTDEFTAKMENGKLNIYFVDYYVIYWQPSEDTKSWLINSLFPMMDELKRGNSILAHLTLKGNFIWAQENSSLYLDGEAFGAQAGQNKIELELPSGNGRRGGDFEMWFWLVSVTYVEYNIPVGLLVENGLCENGQKNCDETQDGIPGGRFYAMVGNRVALNGNSDALVDLLVNEGVGDDHLLGVGQSFSLPGGITFTPREIDVDSKRAKFSLSKDGKQISDKFVNEGEVYTHIEPEIMGELDVPVFVTFVESLSGDLPRSRRAKITSTWLISMD